MTTELNITKKFNLEGIIFWTKPHSLPYYDYVALLFDSQFGSKQIAKEDLVNEGIIIDNSDSEKYPSNVVTHIETPLLVMLNRLWNQMVMI